MPSAQHTNPMTLSQGSGIEAARVPDFRLIPLDELGLELDETTTRSTVSTSQPTLPPRASSPPLSRRLRSSTLHGSNPSTIHIDSRTQVLLGLGSFGKVQAWMMMTYRV